MHYLHLKLAVPDAAFLLTEKKIQCTYTCMRFLSLFKATKIKRQQWTVVQPFPFEIEVISASLSDAVISARAPFTRLPYVLRLHRGWHASPF